MPSGTPTNELSGPPEKLRKKGESVGTAIIVLVLGTIATGILAAIWAGIKSLIGDKGG